MVIRQVSSELPSISALLPSRNGEKYLHRLVPRILAMLRENDELLVVNDGSTDNSALVLANQAISDARVRILTTDGVGLVAALNLGIENAKSPWIARFDVDDEYLPDRLNLQRQLIGNDVAVIFSDYSFISSAGVRLGTVPSAITSNQTKLSLVTSQRTPHPVALLNRANALSVGGYRLEDFPAEDLGLWLRMVGKGKFLSVPSVLLSYRLSGNSISSSNRRDQLIKKNSLISDFRAWHELVESCVREYRSTITYYLKQRNSTARIILHLRDIAEASRFSGSEISITKLLITLPLSVLVKIPFVFLVFSARTIIRRFYRLSKNFI